MTAPKPTSYDVASYVGGIVNASLEEPGGPLYAQMSDLVSMAQGIAMKAAGLTAAEIEAGAEGWPEGGSDALEGQIVGDIVDAMFQAARAYLEGKAEVPA